VKFANINLPIEDDIAPTKVSKNKFTLYSIYIKEITVQVGGTKAGIILNQIITILEMKYTIILK
jgi:hypothetical protein